MPSAPVAWRVQAPGQHPISNEGGLPLKLGNRPHYANLECGMKTGGIEDQQTSQHLLTYGILMSLSSRDGNAAPIYGIPMLHPEGE